ncbi:ferredoxin--NADP reductase [Candidatus Nitrosoglobus terrae]|nr:ferredoxin--NADP reductase [Candidatus Nitrosoglobus terrae]
MATISTLEIENTESLVDTSKWVEGQVIANHHWTRWLYSLQVEATEVTFEAGQFGRLGLIINGEFVTRSYSFVNPPNKPHLEFYSIIVSEGSLSPRLAELKSGDKVWLFRKAAGFLVLSQIQTTDTLWMLSTGTAIGPFLSILQTQEPWQRYSKIVLAHSVRTSEELVYQDLIQILYKQYPDQFIMVPLVSREECEGAIYGRITTSITDGRMAQYTGLTIDEKLSQVMICGNPDMVRDTTALLKEKGLTENRRRHPGQISVEKYW